MKDMETTSEMIADDLMKKIEELEYMPGERLSENELAEQYHVSRHIIRGALGVLKAHCLVEVYPQRGTFVSLIDMDYISDILFIRAASELEAVSRIVRMEDGRRNLVVERLTQIVDAEKALDYSDEDIVTLADKLDADFHQTLFKVINHPMISQMIYAPYIHIRRWRNYEKCSNERLSDIAEEHGQIVEAINRQNEKEARSLLRKHMDTLNRYSKPLDIDETQYFA